MDGLGGLESHTRPGLAPVDGFKDALAQVHRVAGVTLARPYPYDGRVGLLDRHRPDILRRQRIAHRPPGRAAVLGFPDAAGGRPDVDDLGVARHRVDSGDAAAHVGRADVAELQVLEVG